MNSSVVLNPTTPMAYILPELANLQQLTGYIYATSLGALLWDWLMTMPDEYRMLSMGGVSKHAIVYLCARLFTVGFCLSATIMQVAPVRNCQALWYIRAAFEILALNTNNVLMFIRVRAVYGRSRGSTLFFGFWWLVVFGTTLCALFAVQTDHLGPTDMCTFTYIHRWLGSVNFSNAVYSTLVFLAISYRIASQSIGGAGRCSTVRSFFRGDGTSRIVKILQQYGQLCYLVTITMNIAQSAMFFSSIYRPVLITASFALENVMTCRVHRAVVLGLFTNDEHQTTPFALTTFVPDMSDDDSDGVLRKPKLTDSLQIVT